MCEIKPGLRCATDTCADSMAAGSVYRSAHPDGPAVNSLEHATLTLATDPYGPNVLPTTGPLHAQQPGTASYETQLPDGTVMTHHPQPPVTIGGRQFTVETSTWGAAGRTLTNTVLTGPKGAKFFLRPVPGADTGDRQVVSYKSGQPLRINGTEVRVIQIGDILEQQER